jgi:riboflavin kinase/FMN adenylyltransferase
MRVFRSSHLATGQLSGTAVAIGNFDGVHRGHQELFARARATGATAVALTFDPHPAQFFNPDLAPPLITTRQQKLKLLESCGLDAVVVEPFDAGLVAMEPQRFVKEILVRRLGAKHVVVGHGFLFGKKKSGNLKTLRDLGQRHGFETHGISTVRVSSIAVTSTKIREFILMGRVGGASLLLGRDYLVEGQVVSGKGRGRTIGIPTANVAADNEIVPKRGVYAGWAKLPDGEIHKAVVNIGTNPTFEKAAVMTMEAHLLNYSDDLYDQHLEIYFTQRLRDEKRFNGVEELVQAIHNDVEEALLLLKNPAVSITI